MIKIALVGDIGSGKTFIANMFNYPIFSADNEVAKIYNKDRKCYKKLNKILPKFFYKFPIEKKRLIEAIIQDKQNLNKIAQIVHPIIKQKMKIFLKKNRKKKFVILDIPLYLENKLNSKNDIIIYVQSKKSEVNRRLKKRKNYNKTLVNKFKNLQYPLNLKKKKSHFIINNDFNLKNTKIKVNNILERIV